MMKRLLPPCLALVLALSGGCLFSKKSGKPKESTAISAEVEEEFHQRFTGKRAAELVAQGVAAPAAQAQAEAEFRERFGYTRAAKK